MVLRWFLPLSKLVPDCPFVSQEEKTLTLQEVCKPSKGAQPASPV